MEFPKFFRLCQKFEQPYLEDIPTAVTEGIISLNPSQLIEPGQTVAVAVGSRGIANLHQIVKTVVAELMSLGTHPFIVPAMGSHGGATAEGQASVLSDYGITEELMGVPVRSSMEVVEIGQTNFGIPVWFDRVASEADRIVAINRVKPHTNFTGEVESGLLKMLTVGLGKHRGAQIYHRAFKRYSFSRTIQAASRIVLQQMPIAFGVAILENSYHQTAKIAVVSASQIETVEPELLKQAKAWCPQLPFDDVDLLIVDRIGKDISGAGLDTNVTGQKEILVSEETDKHRKIPKIFIRSLTEASHGNAIGIGHADFTTQRLVNQIDFQKTYTNAITALDLPAVSIPIHFATDREALEVALAFLGLEEPENAKILWIKDTLHLSEIEASIAYLEIARQRPDLVQISEPRPLKFGTDGNLPEFNSFGHTSL